LKLFIENDGDLYRHQTLPIIKDLVRKAVAGKYNHRLAIKLWGYLAERGAKKYTHDYGDVFPPSTRRLAAIMLARFYREHLIGDYNKAMASRPAKRRR
jgi:hypothetical protein